MTHNHLKSDIAVFLAAGSLGVASAYADGTPGADDATTPPLRDGVNVIARDDLGLTDELPASFHLSRHIAVDADRAGRGRSEEVSSKVVGRQEDFDAKAVGPEDEDSDWAPLEHLGLAPRHAHTSGGDPVRGGMSMDTDVQYPLRDKSSLGGELEVHHADALSAKTDVEQYSFGFHVGL
jgi:hypothetical protein